MAQSFTLGQCVRIKTIKGAPGKAQVTGLVGGGFVEVINLLGQVFVVPSSDLK